MNPFGRIAVNSQEKSMVAGACIAVMYSWECGNETGKNIYFCIEQIMTMDRFGKIPITPANEQDRPRKSKQEQKAVSDGPVAAPSPEPELEADEQRDEITAFSPSPRRISSKKKKRGGGRQVFRATAWLLAPVFIVLLYAVGSYFLVPLLIKGPLAQSLANRLDRPVQVSRAVFSPFTLRLFLEGITIGSVAGDRNDKRLLEGGRVDCRISLGRIFSGKLICEEIAVKDLYVRINRDVAVSSDLADAWRLIAPAADQADASLWPAWLLPGELTLTGGTVLVDDPAARKQYSIEQIELYLPPLDPGQGAADRLPRLSAVINASPVQVEAIRVPGSSGQLETSFDLKIQGVVLANYIQALPILEERFKLVEGLADLELRLIFPQTGEGAQRILLRGSSTLAGVKIVDPRGRAVISVPIARLNFQIAPLARRYRFSRIVLENPQVNLTVQATEDGNHGLTLADFGGVLLHPIRSPFNLGIEQLQLIGGQINITPPSASPKQLSLNGVNFILDGFTSPGIDPQENKSGPAHFTIKAEDTSGNQVGKLTGEGEILANGAVSGQIAAEQFDFARYQELLPRTGFRFDKGLGGIQFSYDYPALANEKGKGSPATFRVREGELTVADYSLTVAGKKAVAGGTLQCTKFKVEPIARRLSCSSLELADSEILIPGVLTGASAQPAAKGKTWQLVAHNLLVRNAKLHVPLLNTLCSADSDLLLKNFTAEAKDLGKETADNNISAQATIGAKGTVKVSGAYSLARDKGNLQISLQHLDMSLFNPCLAATVIPAVKQGLINIQGNVSLPAKEFAGQVWVNEMVAGEDNGPSLHWQLATADRVALRTSPLFLDLGEIMVRKPVVQPGLVDTEVVLRNFIHPDKPSFQHLAISKISIEDGQFSPFRPVLLPGYQPRLEGVNGSLSSLGQEAMPFSLNGRVSGLGSFTVAGTAGMDRVEHYTLDMPAISLVPFADFFRTELGMSVQKAQGKWQQTMTRAGNIADIETNVQFQGMQPEAGSSLILLSALLLDKDGVFPFKTSEEVAAGSEPPFLLTSVQRHLQRQAVRADISEQLVLNEYFPELQLPGQISFPPGLAEPLNPEGLAAYRDLLGKRPYLRLRLQTVLDHATDQESLRLSLQQLADLELEAENSRRALVKLQRAEKEKQSLEAIKSGKAPVMVEEIEPDELAGDLDPLPSLQVEVTAAMLDELATKRLKAVQGYLQGQLAVDPNRIVVREGYIDGPPQVRVRLEPYLPGNTK